MGDGDSDSIVVGGIVVFDDAAGALSEGVFVVSLVAGPRVAETSEGDVVWQKHPREMSLEYSYEDQRLWLGHWSLQKQGCHI